MAADQPVAQTSLCQLEDLLKGQARGGERLRDRADQELCVGCHLSAEGSRDTCRCVRIDGPSSSRRGRGSGSPPWEDNRLMRGSQLTDEFGVLLVQPVDPLLGIDRTLQQCGILGCELPLLSATSSRRNPGRFSAFRRSPKPTKCTRSRPSGDRDAFGAGRARLCTSAASRSKSSTASGGPSANTTSPASISNPPPPVHANNAAPPAA